jgi:hypothetical protein
VGEGNVDVEALLQIVFNQGQVSQDTHSEKISDEGEGGRQKKEKRRGVREETEGRTSETD